MGPNVRKLLVRFIAREGIPSGGGFADGIQFFVDSEHRERVLAKAEANMRLALEAVKTAPDNPHGDDEEEIAGAILQRLEEQD